MGTSLIINSDRSISYKSKNFSPFLEIKPILTYREIGLDILYDPNKYKIFNNYVFNKISGDLIGKFYDKEAFIKITSSNYRRSDLLEKIVNNLISIFNRGVNYITPFTRDLLDIRNGNISNTLFNNTDLEAINFILNLGNLYNKDRDLDKFYKYNMNKNYLFPLSLKIKLERRDNIISYCDTLLNKIQSYKTSSLYSFLVNKIIPELDLYKCLSIPLYSRGSQLIINYKPLTNPLEIPIDIVNSLLDYGHLPLLNSGGDMIFLPIININEVIELKYDPRKFIRYTLSSFSKLEKYLIDLNEEERYILSYYISVAPIKRKYDSFIFISDDIYPLIHLFFDPKFILLYLEPTSIYLSDAIMKANQSVLNLWMSNNNLDVRDKVILFLSHSNLIGDIIPSRLLKYL